MLGFYAPYPCTGCGHQLRLVMTFPVRVNKRSWRTTGDGLGGCERVCPVCKAPNTPPADPAYRLLPDVAEQVEAYRLKRWPELTQESAA